jgi:hypothetical protein
MGCMKALWLRTPPQLPVHQRYIIIIIIIIIIIVLGISFMHRIYIYIPETNHVPREHCDAAILM